MMCKATSADRVANPNIKFKAQLARSVTAHHALRWRGQGRDEISFRAGQAAGA
jgi:hypothetical protein